MTTFKDKVVVITGGNSGIGRAMAHKFNAQGAKVVIFGRDQTRLDAMLNTLENSIAVQGDVKKISDLDKLYQTVKNAFGRIDVLVANAGCGASYHVSDVTEAAFDEVIDTNFKGTYFTVQRAVPLLNKGASVILISSIAAHIGWPSHSLYSASKAAVSQLVKNFASDLIDDGIRVNAISPGFTDTPIFDSTKSTNPQYVENRSKDLPMGRFAKPEEIADAALFLSSENGAYIVGTDLVVDGGMCAIFPKSVANKPA